MWRFIALLALISAFACGPAEPETSTAGSAPAAADVPVRQPAVPPTPAEALEIVSGSAALGDYQFSTGASFTLPQDRAMFNDESLAAARDLERAGWVRLGANRVELTSKAQGDKRILVRPNGFIDFVPLAKKEVLEVTEVRPVSPAGMEVDFTWRWVPNEIGAAFRSGSVKERFDTTHQATAKLEKLDERWEVMRVSGG